MCTGMLKTFAGLVQTLLSQAVVGICEVLITVSRHLLGGELQSPAADLPPQTDSLFYQSVHHEDELRTYGLGQYAQFHTVTPKHTSCTCTNFYDIYASNRTRM